MIGMTRGTTKSHVVRAALESIAYQTRDVVEVMNTQSGLDVTELRVDGGASQNRWLMQFQSDILGVPIVVASSSEATALGVAYAAGISTAVWSSHDDLQALRRDGVRYEPMMAASERVSLHGRWAQALERARGWAQ
jgi:glycerol kinase